MAFQYVDQQLSYVYGKTVVPLGDFYRQEQRPVYVYNLDFIQKRIRVIDEAFQKSALIFYSMKSNSHPRILKSIAEEGYGVDCVSLGELELALKSGFAAQKIVLSGVGKTKKEIKRAIEEQIFQINFESLGELQRIVELSREMKRGCRVAIRLNPDVNPSTHPYICTGFRENKFGLVRENIHQVHKILSQGNHQVELVGITLHIGSQIREKESFLEAIEKTLPVQDQFRHLGYSMKRLDIGGGVGVNYEQDDYESEEAFMFSYGESVLKSLEGQEVQLMLEPGRFISAASGVLLSEIQYIKKTDYKSFAIVDTGMHHLLRPALYGASHRIQPLNLKTQVHSHVYDIVGPICESSDVLGRERVFQQDLSQGDLLAVRDVGAYGFSMANTYNSHELPREIVLLQGQELNDI